MSFLMKILERNNSINSAEIFRLLASNYIEGKLSNLAVVSAYSSSVLGDTTGI